MRKDVLFTAMWLCLVVVAATLLCPEAEPGVIPFRWDNELLTQQREECMCTSPDCVQGCNTCLPRSYSDYYLVPFLRNGFCSLYTTSGGTLYDCSQFGGKDCPECNAPCRHSLRLSSVYISFKNFTVFWDSNQANNAISNCWQYKDSVHCFRVEGGSVNGAYWQGTPWDVGQVPGPPGGYEGINLDHTYGQCRAAFEGRELSSGSLVTRRLEAWERRLAIGLWQTSGWNEPAVTNNPYWNRYVALCTTVILYNLGQAPYPLQDQVDDINAIHRSTCSDSWYDDCGLTSVDQSTWGLIKARYEDDLH